MKDIIRNPILLYVVEENSDHTEGRGIQLPVAYFLDRFEAEKLNNDPRFYKRFGVMSTKSDVKYNISTLKLQVLEKAEEFWALDEEKAKQNALDKLTDYEKKLLGLI